MLAFRDALLLAPVRRSPAARTAARTASPAVGARIPCLYRVPPGGSANSETLNVKNWATADTTDQIIPMMMKSVMQGASFTATVDNANPQLPNVLNTGSKS